MSSHSLVDFWQSQIGLLTTDSQMSSSILIQEARRRHQPRLDFPWRNPKAEVSCPKPSKAMELGGSLWSLCQYVIIFIAASWQHTVVTRCRCVSKIASISLLLFLSTEYPLQYTNFFLIQLLGHNSSSPWCASHSCDGEVFVMMNRHMGEQARLFCARGGLLAERSCISRRKHLWSNQAMLTTQF